MNFSKKLLAAAILSASVTTASAGSLSANLGATNDYLFRGITQTSNGFSVQGGADYDMGNGASVGTWFATGLTGGLDREIDLYAGYAGQAGGLDYNVNAIYYNYASAANADYTELTAYVSKGEFSGGLILDVTNSVNIFDLGYSTDVDGISVGANLYLYSGSTDYTISAGKEISGFDVSATFGGTTDSAKSGGFSVLVTKSFDL